MINELARLSKTIKQDSVAIESWHRKYKPLPNISEKRPCIRLILFGGHLVRIEPISADMGKQLRRFGSNQGFFPGVNLQPLYRLTDDGQKKDLQKLIQGKKEIDIDAIRSWCTDNNWNPKFLKKYAHSIADVPDELHEFLHGKNKWDVLNTLLEETAPFANPVTLHVELEKEALRLLTLKVDSALALRILFHSGSINKNSEEDYGSLSVIFDCQQLIDIGIPVVGVKFTQELNRRLLDADTYYEQQDGMITDAFGNGFVPFEEPMPGVKLAGGFDVTLRTMFRGQPCQNRYRNIENASYPISKNMRTELASALTWLGSEEHRNITWTNTDKNEILFAYPFTLPEKPQSCVRMFKRLKTENGNKPFEEEAKTFLKNVYGIRNSGDDTNAKRMQIFILRKIDKARTKVIYTHTTDPREIEFRSEVWSMGTKNIPILRIGQPETLFPLDTADILNRFMKQDGNIATDKFHPVPKYHGMELFFGAHEQLAVDLSVIVKNTEVIAPLLGKCVSVQITGSQIDFKLIQQSMALMGFLLLELGIKKEKYMIDFAYLCGQLLKISDELHIMYCQAVRDGDIPSQLAGGSMYIAVSDSPQKSLGVLGDRMNPYINWAKTYQLKKVAEKDKESWRAGWLLKLYGDYACQINQVMSEKNTTRFTDAEKAQLFLGFIAAFPKKDENNMNTKNGGNDNE